MELTAFTQLVIAVGYGVAAWFTYRVARRYRDSYGGTHAVFATVIAVVWAVWYIALALFDLQREPWGHLNRSLHIPVIAFLIIVASSRLADD